MKKIYALLISLVGLDGCALLNVQTPAPDVPSTFVTEEGKACARECQQAHVFCVQDCRMLSGQSLIMQCQTNCNQVAKDCYSNCE